MNIQGMKIGGESPCYFLRRQPDVVPQYLRFHSNQTPVWLMPMCREEDAYDICGNTMQITVLFLKASARCSAPTCPIRLPRTFIVTSAYVHSRRCV